MNVDLKNSLIKFIDFVFKLYSKLKKVLIGNTLGRLTFIVIYYRFYFTKNSNISIAITTSKNYYERTVPQLINELLNSGIDLKDIYVFEGGYEKNEKMESKFNHYRVCHNSFDLTSLISIVELKIDKVSHWLLLHDTIKINKEFKYVFFGLNPIGLDCMPLRKSPSMNIGVYSQDFLESNKSYLMSVKNTDYTTEGLQKSKHKGVIEEDYLFKSTNNTRQINKFMMYLETNENEIYFGSLRKKEIYPQLGITKYKANYKDAKKWTINL